MPIFSVRSRLTSALALAAGVAAACAQEAPPSPLTLSQSLALAASRHPALAARAFGERAAEGLIEQAGMRPNPTLEFGAEHVLGTGRIQGVRSLEATVQASQTWERGGKRDKRVALASRGRDTAAREFAVHRAEILAATAQAFVATVAAQHRLTLTAEPLQLAREIVAAVATRVQAGAASSVESARARAALAAAQADVARSEAALAAARAALAASWGDHAAPTPLAAGRIRLPDALPPEAALRARLADHPRLALQAAIIAGRRATLELEQAQTVADVTASGGARFLRDGSDAGLVASVSVPLPNRRRNQGSIRAAREALAGAEHQTRAIEAELQAAFTTAWLDLQAAHAAAVRLRRDALPATVEAFQATRRAYEAGGGSLLDVLDAQRALTALQREIAEAELSCAFALVRTEALIDPKFPTTAALLAP